MLLQRVMTALLLVILLLPSLLYSQPQALAGLSALFIALGAWEWGRLAGCSGRGAVFLGTLEALVCGISWWLEIWKLPGWVLWAAVSGLWLLLSAWLLRYGLTQWLRVPLSMRCWLGLVVLWSAWLALMTAKAIGTNYVLSILVLVWVADSCAYFAGRTLGRHKLAFSISPGKTWEGVLGAVLGVAVLATVWLYIDARWPIEADQSIYTQLWGHGWLTLAMGGVLLVAMSVFGDLIESLLKRCAAVKDSSQLLPGHGGVLDRIDGLLPTLPMALCLSNWVG